MSNPLRQFTSAGNTAFASYIATLHESPATPIPDSLLWDESTSESAQFSAGVSRSPDRARFPDRLEFGEYLVSAIPESHRRAVVPNHRLWNWLALYFFDELCPADSNGNRKPLEIGRYLFSETYRFDRAYRHLVWGPWMAYSLHGAGSRVLLLPISSRGEPLTTVGEIYSQVAARQGVFRSGAVVEMVDRLYFDEEEGRPRRGAGGDGGGSPRRLGKLFKQFERTFDLEWGDGRNLIGLLPKDYDRWREHGGD
jgi:hypothetical protein